MDDVEIQGCHVFALVVVELYLVLFTGFHALGAVGSLNAVAPSPYIHEGVAIEDEANAVVELYPEGHLLVVGGTERAFVAGTEILERYTGSEDGIAAIA